MERRDTSLGVALVILFAILAPLSDGLGKLVLQTAPLLSLLLARFVVNTVVLGAILHIRPGQFEWPKHKQGILVLRGIMHLVGMVAMLWALQYLPLADTIAIAYIFPFLLLLFAHFFLSEVITKAQIISCGIGFVGVLIIAQPSFLNVGFYALLPILAAVSFSIFQIQTRFLAVYYDPIAMQFWSGVPLLLALILYGVWAPEYVMFSAWPELLMLGVLGALSNIVLGAAAHHTQSARLAPFFYLELPFSIVIGFWLFGDIPALFAWVGIAVIMISGICAALWDQGSKFQAPKRPDKNPSIT